MSLFEKILTIKGYPLAAAVKELQRLQSMGVDEFIHWQQNKAWAQARHHYDNNLFYKNLVGNIFPGKWEDLPVITKKDLQQPLSQLITKGVQLSGCHVGSTSGSTGQPFFYAKDKMSHAMTWAVIADRYSWHGLGFASKQARFYGIPKEFVANKKELFKDRLMNRIRFSVFDLSDAALSSFVGNFRKYRFHYVYGYTNALAVFARYLLRHNMVLKDICPTLKICICTSETCTPEDHKLLQAAFGLPNIREYGVSETCLTAFDAQDYWRLTEETLLTEVVDDNGRQLNNNNEGRLLSTSLYNAALPLIRYETGDIGTVMDRPDDSICRSLGSLSGRVNDLVFLPGGKKSAGLTFYYISRSVLENSGVLREFIIRQVAIDTFVFDIVANRDLTNDEIALLKQKVATYLTPGLNVVINRVPKIERPPSGKLKHFYSELK